MSYISRRAAVCFLFILIFSSFGFAQSYNLKVRLVDSKTGEGVPFAVVSLSKPGSDKVEKYTQTDDRGTASIQGVKAGRYTVKGILLGYDDYSEDITVNKDTDLGSKQMKVQVNFIEGATVSDVGNPIVVKKDTIEHNVSLMKTSDNDVLEDLLKRLPGIEIGTDGSITANGKTISKVYVDGKAFFLDDPQLASKNLPAKIVNKVRVVEKKSEQAEFTGIDDGEEETVLDLNIKKGMMNGWMGNLTGGIGSDLHSADENRKNDLRFQGGGMVARFTDSDQLVFIGNANNTNNRGFSDITGNAMGGMRGGRGMRGGNNGISTSYMIGVNGGKIFENKSELNGNYLFNANQRAVLESTDRTTLMKDGDDLHSTEDSENLTDTYGHRIGARIDWKIGKNTSILWMPNFNYGWGDFSEKTEYSTGALTSNGERMINDGHSLSTGKNLNKSAGGRILWRQKIGSTQGRTISLNLNYNFSDTNLDGLNQSVTNVYDGGSKTENNIDQHYTQDSRNIRLGGRLAYTEPLGRNFFTELTYGYSISKSHSGKDTRDRDIDGAYTVENLEYSNSIDNTFINQRAGISLRKQEKKYNATIGAQYQPSRTVSNTVTNGQLREYDRSVNNWSPNARIDLNFSDYNMLRIRYRGNTNQPSINQLQPVPDNSDPQNISLGNPNLTPSFTHNMNTEYRLTNMKNFASLNVNLNFTYNTNNIVNASWYDGDGIRYTVPINNSKGTTNTNLFMMVNSPIAKSNFSIMSFTMGNYGTGVSLVGSAGIDPEDEAARTDERNFTHNETKSLSLSENLRFVYRNDIVEASLGGGVRYSQAWYSIASQNVAPTWTNSIEGRFIAKIPDVMDISTNARYNFYKGYTAGYGDPNLVWNAEVSRQIFKKSATIAVRMYDILNQSRQTYRTTTDNYVLDRTNNTLGRYFVVSLTWRFGKFGERGSQMPMGGNRGHGGFGGSGFGGHRR